MTGKVYLVGAGPGDPDLLTMKAVRLLRTAEVVLHDDLVSPEILAMISPRAEVTNVGKRCGTKKISQEGINFLLVTQASLGREVVRLKSGDPLIFGRAGEEIAALRQAHIEYEIVPGVTAALGAAAAAGIPLTHRRVSSTLVLTTASHAPENDDQRWEGFARAKATMVIYMPGRSHGEIRAKLLAAGFAEETPCAVISKATTSGQRLLRTTVSELHRSPKLVSPTLLIVGEVVNFADHDRLREIATDAEKKQFDNSLPLSAVVQAEGLRREEESVL